jgi:hypothetical protein
MAGPAPVVHEKNKAAAVPMEEQIRQQVGEALEEQIRRRAHAIYLERGGQDGFELDDWLQAEKENEEGRSVDRNCAHVSSKTIIPLRALNAETGAPGD